MSLTSYRAAPSRDTLVCYRPGGCGASSAGLGPGEGGIVQRDTGLAFLARFGGDLLSHVLRRSTIGATALNCRVRDGIGCFARAMTTKPRKKRPSFQVKCLAVYASDLAAIPVGVRRARLLPDQIKPIGQLVPVN